MSEDDKGNPIGRFFTTLVDDLTEASEQKSEAGPFDDTRAMLDTVSQSLGTSNFRKAIMDAARNKGTE